MREFLISAVAPNPGLGGGFRVGPILVFIVGGIVGMFLDACIRRWPLGQSPIAPWSCPRCQSWIPADLGLPFLGWLRIHGKCRACGAPTGTRHFIIAMLTGVAFLACWLAFKEQSLALVLVYCGFLSGLIVATATDFEHLIIPDEITLGGMVTGVACSLVLPSLHGESSWLRGLGASLVGLAAGGGGIYVLLRAGKMVFGRERLKLPAKARIVFHESAVRLPDREVPFEELFYRKSDAITIEAETVELVDRCYRSVRIRLTPEKLMIGQDEFDPAEVPYLEVVSTALVLPREAMGLGDAKLMAAIGAFLGWKAVVFSVVVGAWVGSLCAVGMIVGRRQAWSGRIYFGPFLALGATLWVFHGPALVRWYQHLVQRSLTGP